jgi:NAD+ synthase (glutamine-hydrolysing)
MRMTFRSIYARGFARVAAVVPRCHLADPRRNAEAALDIARRCHERAVAVAVYPELYLSGYSIEDLLMQDVVLDAVEAAVAELVQGSADLLPVLVVGAPIRFGARIYNAAVVIHRGRLLGVVPKTYLPTYREFYEARHFASGEGVRGETIRIGAIEAPFGTDLIFPAEDVPRGRDLRGYVDPASAGRGGGARGRDRAGEPLRKPDHDRPCLQPRALLPIHLGAMPVRLRLCSRWSG